jgi:hypothetical protein
MKRLPIYLLIGIPVASVLMGIITLIVAFSGPPQELPVVESPLSKTSWHESQRPDDAEPRHVD